MCCWARVGIGKMQRSLFEFDPTEENHKGELSEAEKLKEARLEEEIQGLLNNLSSATYEHT